VAAGLVTADSGAYDTWREENNFCPHTKKRKALLFERSEFKCFAFYKRQKLFLAKCHSAASVVTSPAATHRPI
jgi:hypothetical protein